MTDTREKARALFLTALMVVSVFGGVVAFSGGAAAATDGSLTDVDLGSQEITPGQTKVVQQITVSDSGSGDAGSLDIDSIVVSNTGTASNSQIASVSLYESADATRGSDTQVGSTISNPDLSNGVRFGADDDSTAVTVSDGGTKTLFVEVTLASDASEDGSTIQTRTDASDLQSSSTSSFSGDAVETATSATTLDTQPPGIASIDTKAGSNSVTVNFNDTLDTSTVEYTDFTYNNNNNAGATSISSLRSESGSTVVLNLDAAVTSDDISNDDITLPSGSLSDTTGQQNNVEQTVGFSTVSGPSVNGAVEYDDSAYSSDSAASEIEVAFSESMDTSTITTSNINVYVDGAQVSDSSLTLDTSTAGSSSRLVIDGISSNVGPTDSITVEFVGGGVENSNGIALYSEDTNESVRVTSQTVVPNDPDGTADSTVQADSGVEKNIYVGERIALDYQENDDDYEISTQDGTFVFSGSTGANSQVSTFDSANRNTSAVYRFDDLFSTGSADSTNFDPYDVGLRQLGLSGQAVDTQITDADALEVDVSANAGNRDVEAVLMDDSDEEVATQTVTLDGSGEGTIDFGTQDAGNYTVDVTDVQTGNSFTTDTIEVTEAADGDASFSANTFTVDSGDIGSITIELSNADTATVNVGSEDIGYLANVTVEDGNGDGEVVLEWNTFLAGGTAGSSASDDFSVAADDDEITNTEIDAEADPDEPVDTGTYDLEVRTGTDAGAESQGLSARSVQIS